MKKSYIFLIALAVTYVSCTKDRTCECCIDFAGVQECSDSTVTMTKKDAEEFCDSQNTLASIFGGSCELK